MENQLSLPHIKHVTTSDAAPTVQIHVISLNASCDIEMLPDSGADISAADREFLAQLGEHVDNLPSSHIMPQAVNGTTMKPIGKLPVTLCLGNKEIQDDVHIYPRVSGALISLRVSKGLGILPERYPHPVTATAASSCPGISATETSPPSPIPDSSKEFPTVFDGVICNKSFIYH